MDWRGFSLEQHRLNGFETHDASFLNTAIVVHLSDPISMEWKDTTQYVPRQIRPGDVSIFPSGMSHSARSADSAEFFMVALEPSFLKMAAYDVLQSEPAEPAGHQCLADRCLEGICRALRDEVQSGGAFGRMYSETLATSLAVHVMRKYGSQKPKLQEADNGLPRQRLRHALEYINANLEQNFSLQQVADASGFSPFHFARLFKKTTGLSPHQFVLKQRVERAKHLLMQGDKAIAEVASQVGFCDQSHLALHFKKICGLTPRQFATRFGGARKSA